MKIEENSEDVPIDLRQDPAAYPEPMTSDSFEWSKDGLPLTETSPRLSQLTYSRVSFDTVIREDAGNYIVSATNYVSGSTTQEIGSDTGSLRLDVICKQKYYTTIIIVINQQCVKQHIYFRWAIL